MALAGFGRRTTASRNLRAPEVVGATNMLTQRKPFGGPWLMSTVALLFCLGLTTQAQILNGLVAYWNFDDNLLDYFGEFEGTARGTEPIPFVDGQAGFGKAIKLNGEDQFVEITGGDENELEFPGGSMSIAGWFRVDTFDTDWQALIAKGEGTNWRVARRAATDSIAYAGGVGEPGAAAPSVNDGQWHHFAAISDAATGTYLWIDGTLAESNLTPPVLDQDDFNVMIGENPGARNREWEGEIDDMAIWNRVLTEDEIISLSASPLGSLIGGGGTHPAIRPATANAVGYTVVVNDVGTAVVDPATVTTTLDGTAITSSVSKVGTRTTISYNILSAQNTFFDSGSQHALNITLKDTDGNETTADQTITVQAYVKLDPSWIAPASAYDTGSPGFVGTINQIAVGRTPGDATSVWNAQRQLAGGYIDPATGNPYANIVDPAGGAGGVDANGNFSFPADNVYFSPWVNINQDVLATPATEIGTFTSATGPDYADYQIPGIPGIPVPPATEGSTDNAVAEIYSYLQLQGPKLYTFVVNSDDGFRVSFGPEMRSAIFEAPGGARYVRHRRTVQWRQRILGRSI